MLSFEERRKLEVWSAKDDALAKRAKVLLLLDDDKTPGEICERLGVPYSYVYKWRDRFLERRLDGIQHGGGNQRRLKVHDPSIVPRRKRCTRCKRNLPGTEFYQQRYAFSDSGVRVQSWCKECMKQHSKEQRVENRERARAWDAKNNALRRKDPVRWAAKLSSGREYGYKYRREHPDRINTKTHRRRAALRGAEGSHSESDWLSIVDTYCGACLRCLSRPRRLTRDHVQPIARGGSNDSSNLQSLCQRCNESKAAHFMADYRKGVSAMVFTAVFAPRSECYSVGCPVPAPLGAFASEGFKSSQRA